MFVKRKWSFFNSPFLSIFAIFEIGGCARWEAVTLFIIVTKNSFSHHSIGHWTSFKLMYILYFNNKLKILKTLFKVVLRYFFCSVYIYSYSLLLWKTSQIHRRSHFFFSARRYIKYIFPIFKIEMYVHVSNIKFRYT